MARGVASRKSCMSECLWGIRCIPCTLAPSPHLYQHCDCGPHQATPGFQLLVFWGGASR